MTLQRPKTRPGAIVPALPPLEGIKDPAAREAIRALADGWATRNGHKGTGENRFLTEADLKGIDFTKLGNVTIGGPSNGGGGAPPGAPSPGEISGVIDDLAAQIYESPLFKFLGEQITAVQIDLSFTRSRLESTITGLGSKITEVIAADSALVRYDSQQWVIVQNNAAVAATWVETNANTFAAQVDQVNQIEARIGDPSDPANPNGGLYARLSNESLVRANADGELYGQYTVKIDINGYVTGFGLASTSNNGTPFSEFYVRADRFAIAGPGVPHAPGAPAPLANIPFIVQTTTWVDSNGNQRPPGAYIRSAFIEYAGITTANIRDAAVQTLTIAGQAVTLPAGGTDNTARGMTGGWVAIAALPVNNNDKASVTFFCSVVAYFTPGSGGTGNYLDFEVRDSGGGAVKIARRIGYPNNIGNTAMPLCDVITLTPGKHTLEVWAREGGPDINSFGRTEACSIIAIGLKR